MEYNTILAGIFILLLLFIIVKILAGPIKVFLKVLYSCLISTIGLFAFNIFGSILGFHIGLNFVTILTVGILGIPGVAMLLLLQIMFKV